MSGLRVAVVGSGPAGVYAAAALVKAGGVTVDVLDRLPAPYGLVRYGVAPDHVKMKSVDAALRKVLEEPAVRFLGNVEVGTDLTLDELHRFYDAVVFATGAAVDRRLDVPGEDLAGSFSATDFVAWYSGHPDAELDRFALHARHVVVVGVGNVAVDVARVLTKSSAVLSRTDVPGHVLDVLAASAVTDVTMLGRRGPAYARFTTKELRELGELAGADVLVDPADLELTPAEAAEVDADRTLRANLAVLQGWAAREPEGHPRRLRLRFWLRPAAVLGSPDGLVTGVRAERTALAGGRLTGTGETVDLPAEMVLRSVGYRVVPPAGLPLDLQTGTVPHDAGRVLRAGVPVPGVYVAGWLKRGPTGIIGTNKPDATETVRSLLADTGPRAPERDPGAVLAELAARGVAPVEWSGWEAIDAAEQALGVERDTARVKIADRAALLRTARG